MSSKYNTYFVCATYSNLLKRISINFLTSLIMPEVKNQWGLLYQIFPLTSFSTGAWNTKGIWMLWIKNCFAAGLICVALTLFTLIGRHSQVGQMAYRSRQRLSSPSPGGTEMDLLVMRERPRKGIRNSGYDVSHMSTSTNRFGPT